MIRAIILGCITLAPVYFFGDVHAAANDYSKPTAWLCRPGVHGACDTDLTTTVIAADGTEVRQSWSAQKNPRIDCFYVYPTVSLDPTPNSDMTPDEAEINVVRQQFARFGSQCRRFAPLYRQITLTSLRQGIAATGHVVAPTPEVIALAYGDVVDAWHYYLEHDNQGRGFVLIGHSQGSAWLRRLIREEIDGRPVQARLVSAIILGVTIAVPKGQAVGGDFKSTPLCRSAQQTGCIVSYSTFRATAPPPVNSVFGRVADATNEAACVNPAELLGESSLHPYFASNGDEVVGRFDPSSIVATQLPIDTPWFSLPDLVTASCASNENARYLAVTLHPDAGSRHASNIPGDVVREGIALPQWGLHLADVNIAMGDLVELVNRQAAAYLAKYASHPR